MSSLISEALCMRPAPPLSAAGTQSAERARATPEGGTSDGTLNVLRGGTAAAHWLGQAGPLAAHEPASASPAWSALESGTPVAILPGPMYAPPLPAEASALVDALGYEPVVMPHARDRGAYFLWQGSPQDRAADLMQALRRTDLGALLSFGGFGTGEVVQVLKARHGSELAAIAREAANGRRPAPPLIGCSDAVHLHHFLGGLGLVSPVYFSLPYDFASRAAAGESSEPILEPMADLLRRQHVGQIALRPVNVQAAGAAVIDGGLALANHQSIHTPNAMVTGDPSWANLLLLESGHNGAGLDGSALSMRLSTLSAYGRLSGVDALVLARTDADGGEAIPLADVDLGRLRQTVDEHGVDIPVFFGAPYGHPARGQTVTHLPLPLHTHAQIAAGQEQAVLTIDAVRTRASIAAIAGHFGVQQNLCRTLTPEPDAKTVTADLRAEPVQGGLRPGPAYFACRVSFDPIMRGASAPGWRGRDLGDRDLLLVYDTSADPRGHDTSWQRFVTDMQLILTELWQREQLQQARTLTIASTAPLCDKCLGWLKDAFALHTPDLPVLAAAVGFDQAAAIFASE
jgi:muramoyltetrapeptide carboxypeptidase LdcA involved in peptidoglycan recycling